MTRDDQLLVDAMGWLEDDPDVVEHLEAAVDGRLREIKSLREFLCRSRLAADRREDGTGVFVPDRVENLLDGGFVVHTRFNWKVIAKGFPCTDEIVFT